MSLSLSFGDAYWDKSDGSLDVDSGDLEIGATWTAPERGNSSVTITADSPDYGTKTITFEVVEPSEIRQVTLNPPVLGHHLNRPDFGMLTSVYVWPDDVCFYAITVQELETTASADGVYLRWNGSGHSPTGPAGCTDEILQGYGTKVNVAYDRAYILDPGVPGPPPYEPGIAILLIPIQFRVGGDDSWKTIAQNLLQFHRLELGGLTLACYKGGETQSGNVTDPTNPNFPYP